MRSQNYSYYHLDGAGQLHKAGRFDAECDDDAVRKIAVDLADAICEIWHGDRLVAKLPQ